MEQFSNTSPAVGAGLVVVGANGGRYYAFDAATGALRWEYVADGLVHLAAPLIAGGRVYMAGGDDSHRVHAVEAATGVAVAGWPITLPASAPDIAGTSKTRQRAVSSIASVAGLLVLQTRLDDAMDTNADGVADRHLSRESVGRHRPGQRRRQLAAFARARRGRATRTTCRSSSYVRRPRATRATEVRRWSPPPRRSRPRSSCLM